MTNSSEPENLWLKSILNRCQAIDRGIEHDRQQRIPELQSLIHDVGDRAFSSLHANKLVASALESLAQKLGVGFACPKKIEEDDGHGGKQVRTCGQPARLDCQPRVRNAHGLFQFIHRLESGKIEAHASSKVIPEELTLVPA